MTMMLAIPAIHDIVHIKPVGRDVHIGATQRDQAQEITFDALHEFKL